MKNDYIFSSLDPILESMLSSYYKSFVLVETKKKYFFETQLTTYEIN